MLDLFRLAAGAESSSSKLTLGQVPLLRSKQCIITSLLDARRLADGGMDESSSFLFVASIAGGTRLQQNVSRRQRRRQQDARLPVDGGIN